MSKADRQVVAAIMHEIETALEATERRPIVIGLCGAQGSGKTTVAQAVVAACRADGLRCAALSIDDLYLMHAEREVLAQQVHPLLATRGVPGTHDIALGSAVLDALGRGKAAALPRFDKLRDDRAEPQSWPRAPSACDVVVFEGWCVGAVPQPAGDLAAPVNGLELEEDADGTWRKYANAALAGAYQPLFARIDRLVLLAAPGFEVVRDWRLEQERELAAHAGPNARSMDESQVARFVSHYERLTRHILAEMPARADLVIRLDEHRRPVSITRPR